MRPHRFLHSDPAGGPTLTPPAPSKMKSLPIRQRLNAASAATLKRTAKAVLIEVCELAEHGGQGVCTATNPYLAKRLGASLKTVSATVTALDAAGLLEVHVVAAERNRRYMRPAAAVRACYCGGTLAEQEAAIANLTIVRTTPTAQLTIVSSNPDYSKNEELTIVSSGRDYSNIASRVIGDDQDDHSTTTNDQLRAALAEVEALKKKLVEVEAENASLKAQTTASHTEGGAADVATRVESAPAASPRKSAGRAKPTEPATFTAFWAAWPRREAKADALRAFRKLEADDQAAAASRAEAWLAARPDLLAPERQRFIPHPATWLNQQRWTDTNPQPLAAQPHATAHQSSYAARPGAGAKPNAEQSGELAVALSDFLAQ